MINLYRPIRFLLLLTLSASVHADQLRAHWKWDEPIKACADCEPYTEIVLYTDIDSADDAFFPVYGSLDDTYAGNRYTRTVSGSCSQSQGAIRCTLNSDRLGMTLMHRRAYSGLSVNRGGNDELRVMTFLGAEIVQNSQRLP